MESYNTSLSASTLYGSRMLFLEQVLGVVIPNSPCPSPVNWNSFSTSVLFSVLCVCFIALLSHPRSLLRVPHRLSLNPPPLLGFSTFFVPRSNSDLHDMIPVPTFGLTEDV